MPGAMSPDQLRLDLALAFPELVVRALREDTPIFPGPKLWFNAQVNMADGLPIFVRPDQNEGRQPPGYTDRIHDGFAGWLAIRGWQVFRWHVEDDNGQVHLLLPAASVAADLQRYETGEQALPARRITFRHGTHSAREE